MSDGQGSGNLHPSEQHDLFRIVRNSPVKSIPIEIGLFSNHSSKNPLGSVDLERRLRISPYLILVRVPHAALLDSTPGWS